jgi:hypothetical protein
MNVSENGTGIDGVAPLLTVVELASYCRVDWAQRDKPLRFVSHVDKPRGVYLHWRGKGNLLCATSLDPNGVCRWCADPKIKKSWYALLLGRCWDTHDTVLVLLPEVSFHRAERKLIKESLYGRLLAYTRVHSRSTVSVDVTTGRNIIPIPKFSPEQFLAVIEQVYGRMESSHKKEVTE